MSNKEKEKHEVLDNTKTIVTLSKEAALEAHRRLAAEGVSLEEMQTAARGLRLGVKGGGCSGLSYRIEVASRRDDDFVCRQYGFPVLVDPKSSLYLKGVQLQFSGGFVGSGFKFVNPAAAATCGCGESFAL